MTKKILHLSSIIKRLGIINTIYINLRVFPLRKAVRIPIIVGSGIRFRGLRKGCIVCDTKTACISLGVREGSFGLHRGSKSLLQFGKNGILTVIGKAMFQKSFYMNIGGNVTMRNNFSSNTGFVMSCGKSITFGENCLLGWNVTLIDGDGHSIISKNEKTNFDRPIEIGDNCWIAANASILKGVSLKDGTIIPYGSIIFKSTSVENSIFNNSTLKENISWRL